MSQTRDKRNWLTNSDYNFTVYFYNLLQKITVNKARKMTDVAAQYTEVYLQIKCNKICLQYYASA